MAEKRPRIEDLPEDVREKLQLILSYTPQSLSDEEQRFLRARRGYLNAEEREIFADVLEEKVAPIDAPDVAVREAEKAQEEAEKEDDEDKVIIEESEDGEEIKQINPDKFKKDVLVQMAKDAGLEVVDEDTKATLGDKINSHLRGE